MARAGQRLPPDAAEPDPAYRAALDWVWSFSARPRPPDELARQRARKLDRMHALLAELGDPHRGFPSLLVAGTKGKGSTVAMLAACLREAGYRTGRYTSPHLVNWRERTCVDGRPISTGEVLELVEPVREASARLPEELGPLTTFEIGTALAFLYFRRREVDVAVLEVGVGGRFDATNVVEPLVSVIAPVSYDHTPTLGETLSEIAGHKAGVLRAGRPGIVAPQEPQARQRIECEAAAIGARLQQVEAGASRDWWWTAAPDAWAPITIQSVHPDFEPLHARVGLLGDHQRDNATAAVAALHALSCTHPELRVPRAALQAGLAGVDWPGRLQILRRQPLLVLDGAHNAASAEALRRAIDASFQFERLLLVVGLTVGKDARGVLGALAPRADVLYLTRSRHERSADPRQLADEARALVPELAVQVEPEAESALDAALGHAGADDLVLVSGSLFLVGEALVWWDRLRP